ncbi:hypothetical protein MOSE0_K10440 [Monosporozyma servazzii]
MIEIIYPVYQTDETEVENNNASKFKSLKIAGDFNNWQIEPMVQSEVDSKAVWIYQIKDSLLSNCKNLNDKNEILIHFKFIDDNGDWFIVPDYSSELDEHNNINNVKVAKPNDPIGKQDEIESEGVIKRQDSQTSSWKDTKLESEEPIIETPEATPDVSSSTQGKDIVIEEQDDNSDENLKPKDTVEEKEEEHPIDVPDEVIEEPDTVKENSVPFDGNTSYNNNSDNNILEECPANSLDVKNDSITTECSTEPTFTEKEQDSKSVTIEAMPVVKKENDIKTEKTTTNSPELPTEFRESSVAEKSTEEEEAVSPKKLDVPDSTNMLDSPVAPVAVSAAQAQGNSNTEIDVDIENHDLTVTNKNTEEYENTLRRLLKGFCSWFSWLFGIFHSHEEQSQ